MNRIEFCNLLIETKDMFGISTSELSFTVKMLLPTLRRFEKGVHNFSIKKAIEYAEAIGCILVLTHENKSVKIKCYQDIVNWMIETRSGNLTQREIAQKLHMSYVSVAKIESNKSVMSVDTFLKLLDIYGFTVTMKNEHK